MYKSERILILTKTYPSPSAKYRETTCVAGVNEAGELRRLFPIPFRLLAGDAQFQKWEWIEARLSSTTGDARPESRRVDIDSIIRTGPVIKPHNDWQARRRWIQAHVVPDFQDLESRRQSSGQTLGFLRPSRIIGLDIKRSERRDWTEEEHHKLIQEGLFDSEEARKRSPLRKIPHDFYYDYECDTAAGPMTYRHKITDWEAGALYWNCQQSHGSNWEVPFRQKLEAEFANKDLHFLMGTIHRFPDIWLIVGLFYPPRLSLESGNQLELPL